MGLRDKWRKWKAALAHIEKEDKSEKITKNLRDRKVAQRHHPKIAMSPIPPEEETREEAADRRVQQAAHDRATLGWLAPAPEFEIMEMQNIADFRGEPMQQISDRTYRDVNDAAFVQLSQAAMQRMSEEVMIPPQLPIPLRRDGGEDGVAHVGFDMARRENYGVVRTLDLMDRLDATEAAMGDILSNRISGNEQAHLNGRPMPTRTSGMWFDIATDNQMEPLYATELNGLTEFTIEADSTYANVQEPAGVHTIHSAHTFLYVLKGEVCFEAYATSSTLHALLWMEGVQVDRDIRRNSIIYHARLSRENFLIWIESGLFDDPNASTVGISTIDSVPEESYVPPVSDRVLLRPRKLQFKRRGD